MARRLLLPLLLALSMVPCVSGQGTPQPPKPVAPTPSGINLGHGVFFNATWRFRPEAWNWFNTPLADDDYAYIGSVVRFGFSQQAKRVDWNLEAEQATLIAMPRNSIAPGSLGQLGLGASYFGANKGQQEAADIFIKQAFIRFKPKAGYGLRIGRFEFIDGAEVAPKDPTLAALKRDRIAHRLLGNFAFTHVGRSFDGVEFTANVRSSNVTLMGARADRGVFQVDGHGELDVDVQYGAYTRQIKRTNGELRIFGMGYHDGRRAVKVDNRTAAARAADTNNIRIGTVGGHYIQASKLSGGTVDLLLWGACQFGSWGALEQRSAGVAAELGFQPNAKHLKPWIRGGYWLGTGDDNPADQTHGTFFQALPTPRIYARFPFYNLMNNQDVFAELILRPTSKVTLRSDYHWLKLANARDLWYSGGGAFQRRTFGYAGRATGGSDSLGNVYDVSLDINANRHFSIGAYYGHTWGGQIPKNIYTNNQADLGFVEFTFKL